MKRGVTLLLTIILAFSLIAPIGAFAEDAPPPETPAGEAQPAEGAPEEVPEEATEEEQTQLPAPILTAIRFDGAEIEGDFSSEVFEYNLQVLEHSDTVRLASYKCPDYNAQVKVYYLTNSSGDASGLVVRLENATAVNEYKFLFDSIKELKKTPDASLMSLTFDYGELSPKFSADVFKYTLYLPKDLEVLNINAVTSDENAKVNTPSQVRIGTDKSLPLSVKITSSDGSNTAVYKLNVKRVDKTIAQIKEEMDNPDFESFVEIPFYQTAPFYIGLGVTLFLIALALVLFFTLRKKKSPLPALEAPETPLLLPPPSEEAAVSSEVPVETPPNEKRETPVQEKAEPEKQDAPSKETNESPVPSPAKESNEKISQMAEEMPAAVQQKPQQNEKDKLPEPPEIEGMGTVVSSEDAPIGKAHGQKEKKHKGTFFGRHRKQAQKAVEMAPAETQPEDSVSQNPVAEQKEAAQKSAVKDASKKDLEPAPNATNISEPPKKEQEIEKPASQASKTSEDERSHSLSSDDWLDLDKYKKYK